MAFHATGVIAEEAFRRLRQQASASKQYLTAQRARFATGTDAGTAFSVIQHLVAAVAAFDSVASTPGLAEYAQAQVDDAEYDIVAEYAAMRAAMVDARDGLIAAFPRDENGWLLYQTLDADGELGYRDFTAQQLAPLLPFLDAVIASID